MSRRRWVYTQGGVPLPEPLEVGQDWASPKARLEIVPDGYYDGLRATDGYDISTRRRHREYMRIHGLTIVNDYKETMKKNREERDAWRTGTSTRHGQQVQGAIDLAWDRLMGRTK